jgi:IS5 family transposase
MHQPTNGNDWHFDRKPVSVDAASAFVHAVILTAGDATNATQADALLLGDVVAGIG